MQRLLGLAAATALILSATLAHADTITGYVKNLDTAHNRFSIGDELFNASPSNTVGVSVDELKEGDKVTVTYSKGTSGMGSNARSITMVEPAPVVASQSLAGYVVESCKTELQTHCSQVTPGQNRLLACSTPTATSSPASARRRSTNRHRHSIGRSAIWPISPTSAAPTSTASAPTSSPARVGSPSVSQTTRTP